MDQHPSVQNNNVSAHSRCNTPKHKIANITLQLFYMGQQAQKKSQHKNSQKIPCYNKFVHVHPQPSERESKYNLECSG
jgi:hypothetical protein